MKSLNLYFAALFALLSIPGIGALSEADKAQIAAPFNLLENPGFENALANYTYTAGKVSIAASGSNLLFGKSSAVFTATAAGNSLQSKLYAIPNALLGKPCLATVRSKGGDGTNLFKVLDNNSNTLASFNLVGNTGTIEDNIIPFTCPTSGSIQWQVQAVGAASAVALDAAFLGERRVLNQNATHEVGEVFASASSNCPLGSLAADGSAVSRTKYSNLFASLGISHGQGDGTSTFNLPDYRGRFLRGIDGTAGNDPDKSSRTAMNTGGNSGNLIGSIQSDQFRSHNHTLNVYPSGGAQNAPSQSQGGSGTTYSGMGTAGGNETRPINAYVTYCVQTDAPLRSLQYNTSAWRIQAKVGGASVNLGNATITPLTDIESASYTLTNGTAPNVIAAQLPCSGTNPPTGTTCAAGNGSLGISFNVPAATPAAQVCATFTHEVDLNGSSNPQNLYTTFALVETDPNTQNILQQPNVGQQSGATQALGTSRLTIDKIVTVCGIFNFSKPSQRVVRLMALQSAGTSGAASRVLDGTTFDVLPLSQLVPAPVLTGPYEAYTSQASNYTVLPGDRFIVIDATSGGVTVTLPSSIGMTGKIYTIKKIDASSNAVTIQPSLSQTIDGVSLTKLLSRYETVSIQSDGSNWIFLSDRYKTESAYVTNSGSCAISSQTGGTFSAPTRPNTGRCNLSVGGFSAIPICTATQSQVSSVVACAVANTSSSAIGVQCWSSFSATQADSDFNITCRGLR